MLAMCDASRAVLVGIDIQERLFAAMPHDARETLLRNAGVLLQAARALHVPVLSTEQYPAGLGRTHAALQALLPDRTPFEKTSFSCCVVDPFMQALTASERRQVVLMGMEAHVCVLQTAAGLQALGFDVFVVEDAVCSRSEANRRNALERMRTGGAVLTNTESTVFEWLRDARHAEFKRVSALIK